MSRAATDREDLTPPAGPADRLLVAQDVAEMLAVPTSWVREATRSGQLPHLRLGRYVRYERGAILAWLGEQQPRGARLR